MRPRILIVEDEPLIGWDLQHLIEGLGFDSAGLAETAAIALQIVQERRPELALLDIGLRGEMDGISLAEHLEARWNIPVIFLTGRADDATTKRATEAGAFAHLTKPVRPRELKSAITMALQHHRRSHDLLEKNAWLATLLQNITEGVIATDRGGVITFLNPRAEQITGWPALEAIGRSAQEMYCVRSVAGEPHAQSCLETAARDGQDFPPERRLLVRRDGQEVLVEQSVTPLRDGGNLIGAMAIVRDLSEALRFEHAQKLESIGVLAGGVAHDFNNLLAVMMGNASLALTTVPEDAREREYLDEILRSGSRAADLTAQLLAYAGKGSVRRIRADIGVIVEEIAGLMRSAIPERIEFSIEMADDMPAVECDPAQIQQVVMNLLMNAAEAIEAGPGAIALSAQVAERDPSMICLRVRDTGCGMDAETRARIFEPFFTTKFTGRGLGLAAAHGILMAHSAAIDVDSRPGSGTTFTILIPACGEPVPGAKTKAAESFLPRGTETVLVVDDIDTMWQLLRDTLERLGYRVFVANSGRAALELAAHREGRIDLVLLDLSMPGMSGAQLAERLAGLYPNIALCLMSGYSEAAAAGILGRAVDLPFLQKPFTPEQLAGMVRQILDARQDRVASTT